MKTIELKLPELGLFAITRVGLGVGLGLLLGPKLDEGARRGAGIALLVIGVLTTAPFAVKVFGNDD
jgi:hypothetical protein